MNEEERQRFEEDEKHITEYNEYDKKRLAAERPRKILTRLLLVALLLVVLGWHSRTRYAVQYGVDTANVHIQDEPHDCDFLKAPIGDKPCHYEREVLVSDDKKNVVVDFKKVGE